MAFPSPPHSLNDSHTEAGVSWYWDGVKWKRSPIEVTDAYVNVSNPDRATNLVDGNYLTDPGPTPSQADLNQWTTQSLGSVDSLFDANGDFIGAIHYGSSEPLVLLEGTLWFNTSSDTLLIYDGSEWESTTKPVSQGADEPTDKSDGDLWYDTDEEQLFVYNGATSVWVATGPSVKLTETVTDLDGTVGGLVTKVEQLEGEVDGLKVEKGSLKKYDLTNLTGALAARVGEMSTNNADPSLVTFIGINPTAKDGTASNLVADGDIIELVINDHTAKYSVLAWDSSTGYGGVAFVGSTSGMVDFNISDEIDVFAYPQNGLSASVEYVDNAVANFVPKTGGTFSGKIYIEELQLYRYLL